MTRSCQQWFLIALFLCCVATALVAVAADDEDVVADPDPARWKQEVERYLAYDREHPPKADSLLFVGSSSIRLWPLAESFGELEPVGRGVGGCHISDVNHWFDALVTPHKPRTIVFYAGDNDIAGGKSPRRVANDFRIFARRVHESFPETRIIYLAIKPSRARWNLWPKMREANALIAAFAEEDPRIDFADVATPMLNEAGEPDRKYFVDDLLHLNAEGYRLWTSILKPMLTDEKK